MQRPPTHDRNTEPPLFPGITEGWGCIFTYPRLFARTVKMRLSAGVDAMNEDDPLLDGLQDFLETASWESPQSSKFDSVQDVLITEGLLDELLNTILASKPFWMYEDGRPVCLENVAVFASLLYDIAFLVRYAIVSTCDEVDTSIGALAIREKQRISRFLRDAWHNYEKITTNSTLPEYFQDELLEALLAFSAQLESLYHVEDKSDSLLLAGSHEIGLLILNCWIRFERDNPTWSFFEVATEGLEISEIQDSWTKAMEIFMNDPKHAERLVQKCVDSLRDNDVVDTELSNIFRFLDRLVHTCPRIAFQGLYKHWVHLLFGISRACERQLCSGLAIVSDKRIMPRGIGLIHSLLTSDDMKRIYADRKQNFARMDFVSIIASYSLYAVTEGPDYIIAYMQRILSSYQAILALYTQQSDDVGLAMLTETAAKCVPSVISAVSCVSETSNAVKGRKCALLEAWRRYQKIARLDDENFVNSSKTFLLNVPAWTTCATRTCLCHRKKPCHRLRVCKGCWQTYYCDVKCQETDWEEGGHASLCRRLKTTGDAGN